MRLERNSFTGTRRVFIERMKAIERLIKNTRY